METLERKKDSWLAWTAFATLVFVFSVVMTGCGGDDGNDRSATIRDGGRIIDSNCIDCVDYTDELGSAYNVSTDGRVEMGISIYAPYEVGHGGIQGYVGAVDVAGYMRMSSNNFSECPLREGLYRLRVAGGHPNGNFGYDNSTVFNLTDLAFEAVHDDGRVAILYIPYMEFKEAQPIIGLDGYEYNHSMFGEVWVDSVDGYQCGFYGTPRKIFFPIAY